VPVSAAFNPTDALRFLPEIILTIAGTLLMVLGAILRKRSSPIFGHLALLSLVTAMAATLYANANGGMAFGGMLNVDGFATFFRILVIVVGILTVFPSYSFLARQDAETGEYHALLLFSIAGQCLMAASNDLIMVFIGLEISSIASYVLAGYLRDDKRANEAALKYFLLGSFATAFFLYGVALVYGATGSVNLTVVRDAILHGNSEPVFLAVAAALMFVGLAFKVSAAPFQVWAPDVYQGAPAAVAGFLAVASKAAGFAALIRVVGAMGVPEALHVTNANGLVPTTPVAMMLAIAAILTMTVGNVAAAVPAPVAEPPRRYVVRSPMRWMRLKNLLS
jgi:NADH-quinone oxidoreductase subunit N